MEKQFFFLSGLCRSGSSLMASILNQNPQLNCGIASPLNGAIESILHFYDDGFSKIFTDDKKRKIIKSMFEIMYDDVDKPIIIENNRCFSGKLPLLVDLFPDTKMICMVRSIPDILNSFEVIYQKNLYNSNSNLYGMDTTTVYSRTNAIFGGGSGVLGLALNHLKAGLHSPYADRIFLIEYEELVNDTENVINDVYDFLGLERYPHDFNNLKNIPGSEIVDQELNLEGLHTIRPSISRSNSQWLIPFDLCEQFSNLEYWRRLSTEPDDIQPLDDQFESLDGK
jgi:sulfotransferase